MVNVEECTEYFQFLDELRESGETNMYGAGVYLTKAFGLDRDESREVLKEWMRTFDPVTSAKERAATSCEGK